MSSCAWQSHCWAKEPNESRGCAGFGDVTSAEEQSLAHTHLCFRQHPSLCMMGINWRWKFLFAVSVLGFRAKQGPKVMLFSLLQFFKSAFICLLSTKVDMKAPGQSLWLALAASSGWDLLSSVHTRRWGCELVSIGGCSPVPSTLCFVCWDLRRFSTTQCLCHPVGQPGTLQSWFSPSWLCPCKQIHPSSTVCLLWERGYLGTKHPKLRDNSGNPQRAQEKQGYFDLHAWIL